MNLSFKYVSNGYHNSTTYFAGLSGPTIRRRAFPRTTPPHIFLLLPRSIVVRGRLAHPPTPVYMTKIVFKI